MDTATTLDRATLAAYQCNPYVREAVARQLRVVELAPPRKPARDALKNTLKEKAQAMNARIRLRKLESEAAPVAAEEPAGVTAAQAAPAPVAAEPPPAPLTGRQLWRTFDFSSYDLQAIGAAYASGTPLRKLIPADVPGYIFSEKLNSLGFKKGGK